MGQQKQAKDFIFIKWSLNKNSRKVVVSSWEKNSNNNNIDNSNKTNNNYNKTITAITGVIMILLLLLLLLLLLIIIINHNINNNGNVKKNQVIWLKKCFLRLSLKVFKLSVFLNVSGIWFQNKGPIKDFWPMLVFQKGHLSFKKLFLKQTLTSDTNSKTCNWAIAIDKFKHDWNNTLFKPSNDTQRV